MPTDTLLQPSVLRLGCAFPVRAARDHVTLRGRAAGANADDVALVVGELVTNVFVHGRPRSAVLVTTDTADGIFWVTVSARQDPVNLPPPTEDPDAESGRGLLLAHTLTTVFRCERRARGYQAFVAGFALPEQTGKTAAPHSYSPSPKDS
ncbi:ATP-binding protein [Embleya sp. AB8]|uniref:ATP-binding protein n=1 Tax=Embleya sp. AB8 TaxID=3156304 RepID=UPI003C72854A